MRASGIRCLELTVSMREGGNSLTLGVKLVFDQNLSPRLVRCLHLDC